MATYCFQFFTFGNLLFPIWQLMGKATNLLLIGSAVTSMVIGILGLLGLHFCGAFLIGIPLGHLALNKIKYSNGRVRGKGMAVAGLIMNWLPVIGLTLMFLFSLLFGGFMTKSR